MKILLKTGYLLITISILSFLFQQKLIAQESIKRSDVKDSASNATIQIRKYIHKGIFFSISAGMGYCYISIEDNSKERVISGGTNDFSIMFGHDAIENLYFYFIQNASVINDPYTSDKKAIATGSFANVNFIGLGCTYFLMPSNTFVSTSLGIGNHYYGSYERYSITDLRTKFDGFSLLLKAGKEWRISTKWGVGISAEYCMYDNNIIKDSAIKYNVNSNRISFLIHISFD
jgi:hypothetical protein